MKWKKWDFDRAGRTRRFLDPSDNIFYFREYTSRGDYKRSQTNQLIKNLKCGINPSGKRESRLKYRREAIRQFARELHEFFLKEEMPRDVCVTWMPPSQAPDDSEHDDRIQQVVMQATRKLDKFHPLEILYTSETRQSFYRGAGSSRHPLPIEENLSWRRVDLSPYEYLFVVDDVLTCGTNFRAFTSVVRDRYPNLGIAGFFWALTVNPPEDVE